MSSSRRQSSDVPEIQVDKASDDYTASIELSNACREFYRNRVKATEHFKQSMNCKNNEKTTKPNKRTTIDDAMDKLRTEMASLMDQDLSLMKQLLTLNEAIEDLKTKRLYHVSKDSLRASSQELHASDWSVSETEMFETDDENERKFEIKNKMSSLSLPVPLTQDSKFEGHMGFSRRSDITILVRDSIQINHRPQSSLDSGYGDDTYQKMYNGPIEVSF
ncbi:uncharacterized protein LOC123525468 [Mercenaria mercenaria]|uniref:uncharacterized protein LOC123525468 n=1 Tax=Mercenaria mercenaria TaxID=6596 RepID=UPI001E1D91E5|nr:uncharacterized protein LOC123525468 [Mercenaria mercenaria]